ncbi:aliphatic sulfonate ABC transporter substrate-binding protein [Cohnella sp. CIP 111063]|uniref:ABC transporter substrate-binding protein n=1 Tax=unclassified Cohnella TaxID=2636738 RepID=UPI000B8BE8AB|nr:MULTISPECIES: ABC transporter substrate-binding protein [unclassified Cohnella]OXS53176.1 aliphatic sulfonate ABC transporter substrate-binding protein [Cohnella sp. CIP 111063]PRX60939.1 NitT/TauT family transport system substrate-binding protein [Cohnella sp. SGD-V74]
MKKTSIAIISLLLVLVSLSACGNRNEGASSSEPITVKVGIFKNVSHAVAYTALAKNYFQEQFGDRVTLELIPFDQGADFSAAIATNQIDFGFAGPAPVTIQYLKSQNFRVISGSINGGSLLIIRKDAGIRSLKDLVGKTVSITAKGSTVETQLRMLLEQEGLPVTTNDSGVQIIARAPTDTLTAFRQNEVDAALVPEHWGSLLVQEGLADVLVNWDAMPPNNGNMPFTIMVASDKFLREHRDLAKKAIQANLDAIDFIKKNPDEAPELIRTELKKVTGIELDVDLIRLSLSHMLLTADVNQQAIIDMATININAGYIKDVKVEELALDGLFDLSLLEELQAGK